MSVEKPLSHIENDNEIIRVILEHLILESEEIGIGGNGVVFKLDMSRDNFYEDEHITKDDWRKFLKDIFDLQDDVIDEVIENPTAGKILKVYTPGKARAEFNGQTNIYKMIKDLDDAEYAKVPKTFFSYEIKTISSDLRDRMNKYGIQSRSLDVFFMEYFDGIELKEYIYRKIIDQCLEFSHLKEGDNYKYNTEIYKEIDEFLGIVIGDSFESGLNKLVNYMKEKKIKLEEEILDMIEKTMNHLNNVENVFHNDLHLRNILIHKNSDDTFRVNIIDWDTVARKQKQGRVDDHLVVDKLRSLKYNY